MPQFWGPFDSCVNPDEVRHNSGYALRERISDKSGRNRGQAQKTEPVQPFIGPPTREAAEANAAWVNAVLRNSTRIKFKR